MANSELNLNELFLKFYILKVFFGSKSWSLECGGNISYIARDEDNEVKILFNCERSISLLFM